MGGRSRMMQRMVMPTISSISGRATEAEVTMRFHLEFLKSQDAAMIMKLRAKSHCE